MSTPATPQKATNTSTASNASASSPLSPLPTTPTTPSGSIKDCPICHKELSWLSRKRTCTLCHNTSCRDCASKKVLEGEIVCTVCQKARGLSKKSHDAPIPVVEQPPAPALSPSELSQQRRQLIPQQCYANLHVKIIEARGLIAADTNLLGRPTASDPYCVITLTREKTKRVTNYIESTLSPVWNEEFDIPVRFPNQNLVIKVFDRDVTSKDDEMGYIEIPISSLPNGREITGWAPLLFYENVDPNQLLEVAPGDTVFASKRVPVPAGSVRVSLTLDFKIHQELFAYIRSAVAIPPSKKVQFNVNALYGPGMLVVDLLWWRVGQPILGYIMYVLYWENFLVSLLSLLVWIPLAMHMEYWPSGFFFLMDALMVRNLVKRKYKALAEAEDPTLKDQGTTGSSPATPSRKSVSRKSIMTATQMDKLKALTSATKNVTQAAQAIEGAASVKKPTDSKNSDGSGAATGTAVEEMSLGSFVGTMSMMAPGWVKEYAAYYQPLLRMIADYLLLLLSVMEMSSPLSMPLLVVFGMLGVALLYVQFKLFVMVVGAFILFFFSPFMSILYGVVAYATRPWPTKNIQQLGLSAEFDKDFMSVTANKHEVKKSKTKVATSS